MTLRVVVSLVWSYYHAKLQFFYYVSICNHHVIANGIIIQAKVSIAKLGVRSFSIVNIYRNITCSQVCGTHILYFYTVFFSVVFDNFILFKYRTVMDFHRIPRQRLVKTLEYIPNLLLLLLG